MSATRKTIAELYDLGLSKAEIARRLGLAPPTVNYHVDRLLAARGEGPLDARSLAPEQDGEHRSTPSQSDTRARVAALLAEGLSHAEIARQVGIAKPTVTYHARGLGAFIDERCSRRYDWEAIQRYYDEGHSGRECVQAFGFSSATWSEAVRRGAIAARPTATPLPELLVRGTYRGRHNLKLRLLKEGVKQNQCEQCGVSEWRGEPLTMSLHHINGDRLDNRLENLEFLCPNCHSQTDTFAGRNGRTRTGPGEPVNPPELLSP